MFSNWKQDGTVATYWFIFGPFTNPPVGICAIDFDLKVYAETFVAGKTTG